MIVQYSYKPGADGAMLEWNATSSPRYNCYQYTYDNEYVYIEDANYNWEETTISIYTLYWSKTFYSAFDQIALVVSGTSTSSVSFYYRGYYGSTVQIDTVQLSYPTYMYIPSVPAEDIAFYNGLYISALASSGDAMMDYMEASVPFEIIPSLNKTYTYFSYIEIVDV